MRNFVQVMTLAFFSTTTAQAETLFSPDYCEFIVEFPIDFYTQASRSAAGSTTTAARASINKTVSLAAECWEGETSISLEEFSDELQSSVRDRGFNVSGVLIDRNGESPSVILTATASSQGKLLHVKMISYFGTSSRIDLFVVDEEIAGNQALFFRNSVRKKIPR